MNYLKRATEVMDIEIAGMEKVRDDLDGGFTQAVDAILETIASGGKVVACPWSKSCGPHPQSVRRLEKPVLPA